MGDGGLNLDLAHRSVPEWPQGCCFALEFSKTAAQRPDTDSLVQHRSKQHRMERKESAAIQ